MKFLSLLLIFSLTQFSSAKIKVASLSPLISDLARQIGGEHVEVIDLLGANSNPHTFSPTTKTLNRATGSSLYLAMGKGMESYLPKLRSIVGKDKVLELGRGVRSIRIEGGSETYVCCPNHSSGVIDPHWWHSIRSWRRACTILQLELSEVDPENEDYYAKKSKEYRDRLESLKEWTNKELASIPDENRILVTAQAAFGYFCQEFDFKSIPLRGLNSEQSVTSQYLKEAVEIIMSNNIKAIFPDEGTNPNALRAASKATGVALGGKIYADTHDSIEKMFKHNVTTIVKALK